VSRDAATRRPPPAGGWWFARPQGRSLASPDKVRSFPMKGRKTRECKKRAEKQRREQRRLQDKRRLEGARDGSPHTAAAGRAEELG
jgi:hypothetical protein